MNRTLIASLTAASLALVSCGRPSTSKSFSFDGVGDPRPPKGNNVPGDFAGSIEVTQFNLLYDPFAASFAGDVALSQAYFNKTAIEGLGGFGLLLLNVPAPPRIPEGANSACVLDNGLYPLLGGTLESLDVGPRVVLDAAEGHRLDRDDDEDIHDPASDFLVYITGNLGLATVEYGEEYGVRWDGGTLGSKGFVTAPERENDDPVILFPEDITGPTGVGAPTINGDPMTVSTSAAVATSDDYSIRWNDTNETTNLLGTQVLVIAYGPFNFGDEEDFDNGGESPFFSKFAVLNCLVRDDAEEFVLFESAINPSETAPYSPFTLEDVVELGTQTGKYALSTEDFNGNGQLDERDCSTAQTPGAVCREDGNRNGFIDKMYGLALVVNRRTEATFQACTRGTSEASCSKSQDIFISGNAYKAVKLEYGSAPAAE